MVVFVRTILIANAFNNSGACNFQSRNLSIKLIPTVAMAGSFAKWTYRDLLRELKDRKSCLRWCRAQGLLATSMVCQCGNDMRQNPRPSLSDGEVWRCTKKVGVECRCWVRNLQHNHFDQNCHSTFVELS